MGSINPYHNAVKVLHLYYDQLFFKYTSGCWTKFTVGPENFRATIYFRQDRTTGRNLRRFKKRILTKQTNGIAANTQPSGMPSGLWTETTQPGHDVREGVDGDEGSGREAVFFPSGLLVDSSLLLEERPRGPSHKQAGGRREAAGSGVAVAGGEHAGGADNLLSLDCSQEGGRTPCATSSPSPSPPRAATPPHSPAPPPASPTSSTCSRGARTRARSGREAEERQSDFVILY